MNAHASPYTPPDTRATASPPCAVSSHSLCFSLSLPLFVTIPKPYLSLSLSLFSHTPFLSSLQRRFLVGPSVHNSNVAFALNPSYLLIPKFSHSRRHRRRRYTAAAALSAPADRGIRAGGGGAHPILRSRKFLHFPFIQSSQAHTETHRGKRILPSWLTHAQLRSRACL